VHARGDYPPSDEPPRRTTTEELRRTRRLTLQPAVELKLREAARTASQDVTASRSLQAGTLFGFSILR
jgi:hypothetical protein